MKKKFTGIKKAIWVGILVLCMNGCGSVVPNVEPAAEPTVTIAPTMTSTPTPTATPTPVPTATNTPVPTATNTPAPTATNTPVPTATNIPVPTATSTPVPTATNTPVPTATCTPVPTATNTPVPTATSTPIPTPTTVMVAATFTKQVHKSATGEKLQYWLYTPENPADNMPLIVYLHGGSGKGNDLELITSVDGFPQYVRGGKLMPEAYIVIPQLSSDFRGWTDAKELLLSLIASVKTTYGINENKISLTGHSMGGTGTWQVAAAYPATFSAVAPLSGSVKLTDTNLKKLANLPIWAVVGSEDTIVDPASSVEFVAKLKESNSDVHITIIDGADHFTVPTAYLNEELALIEWLLSKEK